MRQIVRLALLVIATCAVIAPLPSRAQGALTIGARPVEGAEAIAVRGTAPAGRVITITLTAAFSRDLPDVVLSRTLITAGSDGTYAVVIPTAPAFLRGTLVTAAATSADGATASTSLVLAAPRSTPLPLDTLPASVR